MHRAYIPHSEPITNAPYVVNPDQHCSTDSGLVPQPIPFLGFLPPALWIPGGNFLRPLYNPTATNSAQQGLVIVVLHVSKMCHFEEMSLHYPPCTFRCQTRTQESTT